MHPRTLATLGRRQRRIKLTAVDLIEHLSKFEDVDDIETMHAFFKTKISPDVYLNTIFKPASREVVRQVAEDLALPDSVIQFYQGCNGAHLFLHALSIYGCLPVHYLLDRKRPLTLPPFNIRDANHEMLPRLGNRNVVCVAWYQYDGSSVCVDRRSQEVVCFLGKEAEEERCRWKTLEQWLASEILRLSLMFDKKGKCLVDEKDLLPTALPKVN
jgi:hypothetical protein